MEVAIFLGACVLVAVASMLMLRHDRAHRARLQDEPQTLDTRGPDDR